MGKYHVLKGNNVAFCGRWTPGDTEAKVLEGVWGVKKPGVIWEPIEKSEICRRCLRLQTIYREAEHEQNS